MVTASLVKELREKTNAGMLDCKKALEESQGNFEAAVEWLRKKGLSSAAKKADRLAAEGLVAAALYQGKTGALVEVNSETDFVARNEQFQKLVQEIAHHIAAHPHSADSVASLLDQSFQGGAKIGERLKEAIAKIGENLLVRRFVRFSTSGYVHTYVHGEGKIAVMVELSAPANHEAIKNFAHDMCLHIAAMNPISLSAEEMPKDVLDKEREILKAKNLEQGKKPEMVDKIVEGQIKKFLAESVLLEQSFVKNPDLKVKDNLSQACKASGVTFTLLRFQRFELGEGLQKRSQNFAEEVAAQTQGLN
ncbi:MAG: translation elongation factor Ts [Bdellovibrio sp.]